MMHTRVEGVGVQIGGGKCIFKSLNMSGENFNGYLAQTHHDGAFAEDSSGRP